MQGDEKWGRVSGGGRREGKTRVAEVGRRDGRREEGRGREIGKGNRDRGVQLSPEQIKRNEKKNMMEMEIKTCLHWDATVKQD